jgi:hypothetical protein
MQMASSNHPIRPRQHVRQNLQTNLLGRFEIDHKLKLHRLSALQSKIASQKSQFSRTGWVAKMKDRSRYPSLFGW